MDQELEPVTLHPSRWRTLALLAISLFFAGLSLLTIRDGEAWGWLGLALFGMCAVVFAAQLVPGLSYLRLDEDGFTERVLWRERRWLWSAACRFRAGSSGFDAQDTQLAVSVIGAFAPGAHHAAHKTVVFDLEGSAPSRLSRRLLSYDDALVGAYGQRPEALAATMNRWKARSDARRDAQAS